jgi:hypothetical protein
VAQRVLVDIDPAGGVGQRADTRMKSGAVCGGTTWIMSKDLDVSRVFCRASVFVNQAFFAGPSMRVRLCMKCRSASYASTYFHQRRHIVLDAEQHAAGIVELDVDVAEPPVRFQ